MRIALTSALLLVSAGAQAEEWREWQDCSHSERVVRMQKFKADIIKTYLGKLREGYSSAGGKLLLSGVSKMERILIAHGEAKTADALDRLVDMGKDPKAVEQRREYQAGYKLAKLYGYALRNQQKRRKPGGAKGKYLDELEKFIIPALLALNAGQMRQEKPDGPSAEQIRKRLTQGFRDGVEGKWDAEMKSLTGVSPQDAPDLLARAGPPAQEVGADVPYSEQAPPASDDAERFRRFIIHGYLGGLLRSFLVAGRRKTLGDVQHMERVLILSRHGSPTDGATLKLRRFEAGYTVAKLYGYAVGNEWRRVKRGGFEGECLKELEKSLIPKLLGWLASAMSSERPDAGTREQLLNKLMRYYKNGVGGEYDADMQRLTGVSPEKAPDLFDAMLAPQQVGTWLWYDGRGEGRVTGTWRLSLEKGKHGHRAVNTTTGERREWKLLGYNLMWMREDGFIEATFLPGGDVLSVGCYLNDQERKRIAEGKWLPTHPGATTYSNERMNQRLQKPKNPRDIIGVWGMKGELWGTGPGKLNFTIAPDPRSPLIRSRSISIRDSSESAPATTPRTP